MSRLLAQRLSVALIAVFSPIVAFAADAADGGGDGPAGGVADVIQLDPVILVFTIVVFLTVMFFLKSKAWGPLLAALEERERKIEESRTAAEKATADADRVSKEHEAVLAEARAEASAIVEAGKREAEAAAASVRQQAAADAEKLKDEALGEIEAASRTAVEQIHQRSVDLALEINEKLVGKRMDAAEHRGLIDEVIRRHDAVAS